MVFYLWATDASTGYQPQRLAEVEVEGAAIRVREAADDEIATFLRDIGQYPALPFVTESREDGPEGPVVQLQERMVKPGEPDYGFAVSQVASKAGGFDVSFTPELV